MVNLQKDMSHGEDERNTPVIVRNEDSAVCEACGIEYVYVDGQKRFA